MDVHLCPEWEKYIEQQVQRGWYESPQDVVNEALILLFSQEHHSSDVQAAVDEGIAQCDRGEMVPAGKVIEELRIKYGIPG